MYKLSHASRKYGAAHRTGRLPRTFRPVRLATSKIFVGARLPVVPRPAGGPLSNGRSSVSRRRLAGTMTPGDRTVVPRWWPQSVIRYRSNYITCKQVICAPLRIIDRELYASTEHVKCLRRTFFCPYFSRSRKSSGTVYMRHLQKNLGP